MKKYVSVLIAAFLVVLSVFVLVSCSPDVKPSNIIRVSNTFGSTLKSGSDITVSATYKTAYFYTDSSEFNKDLAMLSFVGASSMNKEACLSFYETIGFSDKEPSGWDTEPTADSVAFMIARKHTVVSDIIGITVRGFNYESEWANNMTIGASGDHNGFSLEAEKILMTLNDYINTYVSDPDNIKIWIMGYSRGGGISGLVAHRLLSEGLIEEENLYAYTFEAPASLCAPDTYECIHNVRNTADLIPYIPPAEWGFYHAGVETDIYSENMRTYLINDLGLDEEAFPEFDDSTYSTPGEFITDYLINGLLKIEMFSTRDQYVSNVQSPVTDFITILMADRCKGLDVVKDYFSDQSNILDFLSGIASSDEYAYDTFKPLFIEAGVDFDDSKLMSVSVFFNTFINAENVAIFLVDIYLNNYYNTEITILSHYPEVTYIALKHYQP